MPEFVYDPVPDLDAYLARINYPGTRELTRENLNALVLAHQLAVPFEGLDLSLYHKPVTLDTAHLFEKVVRHGRGGYCYELNGLFVSLLRSFGFDAVSVMCRLINGRDTIGPVSHRGCLVRLDGKRYFCDVGYGGAMAPFAIEISPEHQAFRGETFWAEEGQEGWIRILRMKRNGIGDSAEDGGRVIESLYFAPIAFANCDFNAPNAQSSAPTSGFSRRVWVTMRTENGYKSLIADEFTVVENGEKTVRQITEEELAPILEEHFRLHECEYAV